MKLILTLIIVIVLLINCSHSFDGDKCFKFGQPCVLFGGDVGISCGDGLVCLPIDQDEKSEYICKERLKLGDKCKEQFISCEKGAYCLPMDPEDFNSTFTCQGAGYASAGEDCDSDFSCFGMGEYGLKCINSKCTYYSNETMGNDKISCLGPFTCPGLQFCNIINCGAEFSTDCTSTCEPLISLGGNCSYSSLCYIGGVCSIDGICIPRYSKKLNDSCSSDNECDLGLRCLGYIDYFNPDGTFNHYEEYNRCVEIEKSNTTNCIDNGCGEYEICNGATNSCHPKKKYTNECKYAERARDICIISNKCGFSNDYYDSEYYGENSCPMKKCGEEVNNALKQCQTKYTFCD
ncbi:hypothetical protein ACTA71_003030 [Dictyostelium dimigraforme]